MWLLLLGATTHDENDDENHDVQHAVDNVEDDEENAPAYGNYAKTWARANP